MKLLKKIADGYHKFLENLAKQNEETFGEGKLECCQLNKGTHLGKRRDRHD